MKDDESTKLAVYFNSACPICSAGIERQKKRSTMQAVDWHDIHADETCAEAIPPNIATIRKYLHVTDRAGGLKVGINAFIALWQVSESERWKAKLISLPVINSFAKGVYYVFANGLYCWNMAKKRW